MLFKKSCKNGLTLTQIMYGFAFICFHMFAITNNISRKDDCNFAFNFFLNYNYSQKYFNYQILAEDNGIRKDTPEMNLPNQP